MAEAGEISVEGAHEAVRVEEAGEEVEEENPDMKTVKSLNGTCWQNTLQKQTLNERQLVQYVQSLENINARNLKNHIVPLLVIKNCAKLWRKNWQKELTI